tara:strand:+ start:1290 stop:1847 length:558 start_codon:yes stop_codon:yes gene_type:complete
VALQTSGQITMADIHVEAAGSPYAGTGTSSLNDADIRALYEASGYTINNTAGTMISMSDFYGASADEVQNVTVGTYVTSGYITVTQHGFGTTPGSYGSVSDGTLAVVGNKTIEILSGNNLNQVNLRVTGSASNSGWTTMNVAGTNFSRSSATYTNASSSTTWLWSGVSPNPFGTTVGASKAVTFT